MYVNKHSKHPRKTRHFVYLMGLLLSHNFIQAAQPSNVPLSVKSTVPLNLIITVDDTLNMGYTHSPEGQESYDPNYNLASPDYNGLFYNPDYTYETPPRFIMEGGLLKRVKYPIYSFSAATVDGYMFKSIFGQSSRADSGAVGPWNLNYYVPRGWDETAYQLWNINSTTPYHYYRWDPNAKMRNGSLCGPDPRLNINKAEIGWYRNCWPNGKKITDATEQQNYSNWLAYYASRMNRVKTILAFLMADLDESVRVTWQSTQGCYSAAFNANENRNGYTRSNLDPYRCYGVSQTLAPFTGQHKADFYTFLHGQMKQDGELNPHRAAMKRVNDYLKITGPWSPYREEVGKASSKEYSCRPTVHLIATHGKFGQAEDNAMFDSNRSSINGDFRNDVRFKKGITQKLVNKTYTLPDGKVYTAMPPYKDSPLKEQFAKSLSDYAFEGWAVDARPDLLNNVAPIYRDETGDEDANYWNPKNDSATWQHVTTYVLNVGGLKKKSAAYNLNWDKGTYNGSYEALLKGTAVWPITPGAAWCVAFRVGSDYGGCDNVKGIISALDDWGTAQTIVDSWHAALNGRGQVYNAEDLDKWDNNLHIWDKIRNDLMTAGSIPNETTTISVASDSSIADDNTFYYETKFDSFRWIGMITQYQYDKDKNKINYLEFHSKLTSTLTSQGSSRKIYINTGEEEKDKPSIKGKLIEFTTGNYEQLSKRQQEDLQTSLDINNAPTGADLGKLRLEWLRGNSTNEGTLFRERYKGLLLGDIVNNTPLAIKPPEGNPYYMDQRGVGYQAFKTAQANRPTYLYVGANDGMLHVFNQLGEEVWAFIPAGVAGKLNLLSDKDYASINKLTNNASKHRFYVDGPLVTDDVYFNNAWHTVLIGTLGRGGQGLFALDVTNPNQPSLLWEYGAYNQSIVESNASTKKAPGYVLSAPVIGPLVSDDKTTTDYVIVGNGYGSTATDQNNVPVYTNGSAIAINIATGQLTSSLGVVASPNNLDLGFAGVVGMKKINPVGYSKLAIENNKFYTGNTLGEVYMATPIGAPASQIIKGNELLTKIPSNRTFDNESYQQAITASPELARVKIMRNLSDILFVGTGKYFEEQDSVGILNARNSIYGLAVAGNNVVDSSTGITGLVSRTVVDKPYSDDKGNLLYKVRYVEGGTINWSSDKGFYIDLPKGEAVIDQPYAMGSVVFVMVMVMNSEDPCNPETNYWLMAIDPRSGKAPDFPVFDLNGDGVVDKNDSIVSGILLKDKPILQGGSNAIAVTNDRQIAIQPYDSNRVRINRVDLKGDSFFQN